MINLLPPEEKELLIFEQRKNLAIIICIIFLAYLLSLALIFLIVNFSILLKIQQQQDMLSNSEKLYQNSDFVFFKNLVEKNNQSLNIIDKFYKNNSYVSDVVKSISEVEKPSGLNLTDITIERGASVAIKVNQKDNGTTMRVTLLGLSDDRDTLSAFKENLEKNQKISNIDFPADNWLKAKDINFYLTFQYQP